MTSWPDYPDRCIQLFRMAANQWQLPFESAQRILEIGCAEVDFLSYAAEQLPYALFDGIDVRKSWASTDRIVRIQGDVLTHQWPDESFDWVILISALEHIGLGHYGDPIVPEGDALCVALAWRWLRPGGRVYFDVPFHPQRYSERSEYRVYNPCALSTRLWDSQLWTELHRGYHVRDTAEITAQPADPALREFDDVICVWQKRVL